MKWESPMRDRDIEAALNILREGFP